MPKFYHNAYRLSRKHEKSRPVQNAQVCDMADILSVVELFKNRLDIYNDDCADNGDDKLGNHITAVVRE